MTLFPDWQRSVFTMRALFVAGFIYAVSVRWDVTRGGRR